MPQVPAVAPPPSDPTVSVDPVLADRTCGRCRGTFAGDREGNPSQPADWWLCPNCQRVLLPNRAARIEAAAVDLG